MAKVKFLRSKENPIISPIKEHPWEAKLTFNPAAIYLEDKVHILYRAMSEDNTSTIGYAQSKDGIHIVLRLPYPIYSPRETFERKLIPNANSGAEDPRIIQIEDKIYMLYTAYDGKNPPRVALTWIKTEDFLNQNWNWARSIIISPPGEPDKDAAIFPEKINGKYVIIHRLGTDMDLDFCDSLSDFDGSTRWLKEYNWIGPRDGMWDELKVGLASPPIKTDIGWLVFYHGVSKDRIYRVGAVLCDLNDPMKILGRTKDPLFEPEEEYEKVGEVPNVVFPCGTLIINDEIFMYYGGADKVVCVATIKLQDILSIFKM